MKTKITLFILVSFLLLSCSNNTNKKSEVKISAEQKIEVQKEEPKPEPKPITDEIKYKDAFNEALFFKCRSDYSLQLGSMNFVQYESIDFDGKNLDYLIVTIPKHELSKEQMADDDIIQNIDSIRYKGTVRVEPVVNDSGDFGGNFSVEFNGEWISNSIKRSPYTSQVQNYFVDDAYFTLSVNAEDLKVYDRDNLYLELRIFELEEADLSGYSKEALGYIRNEVFARHGHCFKTTKMKSYFDKQTWYKPYSEYHYDATEFLNETEKKNVALIKTLESKL